MTIQLNPTKKLYQLKITLDAITPPIWRRILVASDTTLFHLHMIIQAAMPWENAHLFAFRVNNVEYSIPMDQTPLAGFGAPNSRDAGTTTLAEVAPNAGVRISYLYDFGDGWQHTIQVEEIKPFLPTTVVPLCIKGKRNTPPEDSGGPYSYDDMLLILRTPKHREHKNLIAWLGGGFDPEHFDLDETNARLAQIAEMPSEIILSEDMLPPDSMFTNLQNPFQMLNDMMASMEEEASDWLSPRRSQIVVELTRRIANHVVDHDLGFVTGAGTVYAFNDEDISPAIAFIAKGRLASLPDEGIMTILPDLVIEVEYPDKPVIHAESAANIKAFRKTKIATWHFLPHKKQVKVYIPGERDKKLGINETLNGGTILPGFSLSLAEIFSP